MVVDRLRSLLDAGKRAVAAGPSERRGDARRKVSLKAEILPFAGFAPIRIVNASSTGFAGETTAPLQPSHPVIFSMEENKFHKGTVRWVRGQRCGADLDDAFAILGCPNDIDPGFLTAHAARLRRRPVDLTGQIAVGWKSYRATVLDVSQSGLRLELEPPLNIGTQIILRLGDRPLILASVRWSAEKMVGVETAERMQTLRLVYTGE